MKIAVIGASGEIGSRLTQRLFSEGKQPRALSRSISPRLGRYAALDFHAVDLMNRQRLIESLHGCDVVVNCAVDKSSPTNLARAIQRNMEGCQNLLDAAKACRIQRIVHLSSIVVWPPKITNDIINSPIDSKENDWYTRVKLSTEKLMLQPKWHGQVVVIRPGIVYGPYMNWSRHVFSRLAKGTTVLPTGDNRCYAVHVDDVVGLILYLTQAPSVLPLPVWAINPEICTWKGFIEAHAQAIGYEGDSAIQVPSPLIKSRCNSWKEGPSFPIALLTWLYRSPFVPEAAREYSRQLREKLGKENFGKIPEAPVREDNLLWPSRFEYEMFSSDGNFENIGIGYKYGFDLKVGCHSAAQWWQWECAVTAGAEVPTVG